MKNIEKVLELTSSEIISTINRCPDVIENHIRKGHDIFEAIYYAWKFFELRGHNESFGKPLSEDKGFPK